MAHGLTRRAHPTAVSVRLPTAFVLVQGAAQDWRVVVLDANFLIDDAIKRHPPFAVINDLLKYRNRLTFTLSRAQVSGRLVLVVCHRMSVADADAPPAKPPSRALSSAGVSQMAELTGLAPRKSREGTYRHKAAQTALDFIQNPDKCPKDQMQIMNAIDSQALKVDVNTTNQGRDYAMVAWAKIIKDHLKCPVWIFSSDNDARDTAERVDEIPTSNYREAWDRKRMPLSDW